ncbi:MAG: DUF1700 domain-containing protein [Oscillospiraceae bacterium]
MTKQKFLAELSRLLVFMTEEDRAETIRRYNAMFDAAGPEGEDALLEQLGTPTRTAIALSRGYEPGSVKVEAPAAAPAPAPAETPSDAPQKETLDEFGLPEFTLPGLDEEDAPTPQSKPAEEPLPKRVSMPKTVVARDSGWDAPPPPAGTRIERTMSLGLGIPLFIFVMIALGLPVAAVFLALIAVLLLPGGALLTGVYLTVIGALWCTAYMADAILLFGTAFVVLAVALIVLWAGIWVDVKLGTLYVRGVKWLAGELLGRRVTDDE